MIPRKRIVQGKEWKIKQKIDLTYDDGTPILGMCDMNTRTIWIKKNMPESSKLSVLCHELTHSVFYELEVKLSFNEEERVVEAVENMLFENFNLKVRR